MDKLGSNQVLFSLVPGTTLFNNSKSPNISKIDPSTNVRLSNGSPINYEKQVNTDQTNSLNASNFLLKNPIQSRNNSTSQIRGSIKTNIGNDDYNKRAPTKNPFLTKVFQN
jgi:hypothetical protein